MSTTPADAAVLAIGVVVVVGTTSSVIRTLVVPRGLHSIISGTVSRVVLATFHGIARRLRTYERRDGLLTWSGPLLINAQLAVWLLLYLCGYALMLAGFSDLTWSTALREAGSSLFTLGFASSDRGQLTAVDFLAAATGPILIGLLIGYLPSLYSSYNRREVEVTLLVARAGEPSWGPEILARHSLVKSLDELPTLWVSWERWAAEVSESHTTYPVLVDIRSTRPMRNWLVALVAVLDAAAMQIAMNPSLPQGPMRVVLRQGTVCIREVATSQRIPFDPDPSPDSSIALPFEQFVQAYELLTGLGYPAERSPEEAWPHFRGWRVNYETPAYGLMNRIDAPPAWWAGPRTPATEPVPPHRPPNRQPSVIDPDVGPTPDVGAGDDPAPRT